MPIRILPPKDNQGEGSFEPVPDKKYTVVGFDFIKPEETDEPFFGPDNLQRVITRLKFITQSGEEGPAISVTASEFVCMVNAFGAADFNPPHDKITSPAVMLEGQQKANAAGKALPVESKGGWVRSYALSWMHPPEDRYTIKFKRMSPPDDYKWKVRDMADGRKWVFITPVFEIVGDYAGKPCAYNGFEISTNLNQGFTESFDDPEHGKVTVDDLGTPILNSNVSGMRWQAIIQYFAPDIEDYVWETDPEQSRFGVNETYMPQGPILKAVEEAGLTAIAYCNGDRYWGFDPNDLKQHNKPVEVAQNYTLQDWVEVIESVAWGEDVTIFESTEPIRFVGGEESEWVKAHLAGPVGIWSVAGLADVPHNFEVLNQDQINALVSTTKTRFGK